MLHFILWLNLLCTSITRGIIGDIVGGGGGIPGLGDLTKTVNGIVDKVNIVPEILDVVDEIEDFVEDIEDTANSVANKVSDIVKDTAKLVGLLENPLKSIAASDDIKDLANTLAVCVDDMKQLIPGAVLLDGVFDLSEDILDIFPFDPKDIVFQALAGAFLPLKAQVEFICFNVLPSAISMVEGILDQVPSFDGEGGESRRRLWEYDDCTEDDDESEGFDGFCKPTEVKYAYDDNPLHKGTLFPFLILGGFFPTNNPNGRVAVHADALQFWRIAQYILNIILNGIDEIVDGIIDCMNTAAAEWYGLKCAASAGKPRAAKWLFHLLVGIVDFAVASAEYHDGNILGARVDAIFYDRQNIIHNQLRLRDSLNYTYHELTKDIATLQATVDSLPNLNGAGGGNGNGNGAKANADYGTLMDEKTGDEGLNVINLRLKTRDLYIVAGLFIGFIAIFIGMTVALILNCCNGSNSGYHRVVKYETESEIEQK